MLLHPSKLINALIFTAVILFLSTHSYSLCGTSTATNACFPCSSNCSSCSSQNNCTACSPQYYLSSSYCLPCLANCLTCTNSTVCTTCTNPFVLNSNFTCDICTISNAISCSSTVTASSCASYYYLSDGYCDNCMLNCLSCSSSSTCNACGTGYYLNATVITCNPCSLGCSVCNQYSPSNCTSCLSNYIYDSNAYTCTSINCTLPNCLICSSLTVCSICKTFYYWDGSSCSAGASITCENGASGILPTQCINSCSSNIQYEVNVANGSFKCIDYLYAYKNTVSYTTLYYYAFNNYQTINLLTGSNNSLILLQNN